MGNCTSKKKTPRTPEERYAQYKAPPVEMLESSPGLLDPFEKTEATVSSSSMMGDQPATTPTTVASASTNGSPYYFHQNNNTALVPIATARKGRALMTRLEKAKQMQFLLSNGTTTMIPNHRNMSSNMHKTIPLEHIATAVAMDSDGHVYVGTEDGTLLVCDPQHSVTLNHHRPVKDICILPNSNLAVAVADACYILDPESLETIHTVRYEDRVYALAICKQYLVIAGFSSTVNFVDYESFVYQHHIERDGLILTMDCSMDDMLAVGGSDKTVGVFLPTGKLSYEIRRNTTILRVAWSSTRMLAVASKDSVGVFRHGEDVVMYELTIHGTTGLTWSPSGRYLCTVGPQGSALYTNAKLRHTFNEIHTCAVWGQFGTLVLAGEQELQILRAGETTVDDASSTASYFSNRGDWVLKEDAFEDLDQEPATIVQDANERDIVALAFSKGSKFRPSSYLAVSTEEENLVIIRNGADYSLVAELEFPATVATMTFSYGSRYLALGCNDAYVYIYDTTANWELVTTIEFSEPITALSFTVRNEWLFVGSMDGTVAFLNVENEFDFEDEIEGYESGVTSLDCSSKHVAAGRDDGVVSVFAIENLEEPIADLHRDSPVTSICFGVNSRFLAVGDAEGLVGVYSAKGGWVLSHQVEMDNSICMVRWCAQGRHLAVSDVAGSLKVFDTIFWQEIGAARQPHSPSGSKFIDFSQDGKYLAIGSDHVTVLETSNEWEPVLGTSDKDKDP